MNELEIIVIERNSGFNSDLKWLAYLPQLGNDNAISSMWSEGKTKGAATAAFVDAYDGKFPFPATLKFTEKKAGG